MALPAWFMLAFNAAVSVNQVRYNLLLIPAYSTAGALALLPLVRRMRVFGVFVRWLTWARSQEPHRSTDRWRG